MFNSYYPDPYGYSAYRPSDNAYLRALAEERAAQQQYEAARRAEQEARERAARARLAQERLGQLGHGHGQQWSAYLDDDEDDGYGYGSGYTPNPYTSFGYSPRERAYLEEQRRRQEMLERLERERERERERLLQEQRLQEQQRELERLRRLEQETLLRQRQQAEREEAERRRRRQSERFTQPTDPLDAFYRSLGIPVPQRFDATDVDDTVSNHAYPSVKSLLLTFVSSQFARGRRQPPLSSRARTQSPGHTRARSMAPPSPKQTPHPAHSTKQAEAPRAAEPARSPKPSSPQWTPEQHAAASKIQTFYRTNLPRRKALASIASVGERFDKLKSEFSFPATVDFILDGETVHVTPPPTPSLSSDTVDSGETETENTPRLAYTHNNTPLHAYAEQLNRLLISLDTVESGGDKAVRERRKEMVRKVEAEAENLDRWRKQVWKAYLRAQSSAEADVPMQTESATAAPVEPCVPATEEAGVMQTDSSQQVDAAESATSAAAKYDTSTVQTELLNTDAPADAYEPTSPMIEDVPEPGSTVASVPSATLAPAVPSTPTEPAAADHDTSALVIPSTVDEDLFSAARSSQEPVPPTGEMEGTSSQSEAYTVAAEDVTVDQPQAVAEEEERDADMAVESESATQDPREKDQRQDAVEETNAENAKLPEPKDDEKMEVESTESESSAHEEPRTPTDAERRPENHLAEDAKAGQQQFGDAEVVVV
ncbi:hypothetical protein PUNSTDRAFT_127808 [Punctularia strigosozonata HHB-11173 SS5]|uniref:uncharacterized protein n=1 Tax=Punctularia strigosozonata (strain HHB-11173) TaxID=741275 RepID=UPI000441809D|nr:uncharacterized protein PUNSTDRAFT_127808 [Punctularia strigosozonata HHB-11173 SS5]EIN05927.1 hypothetical protein PUNSTDRAFT_127808 [Punctularia strigosozonata HHB-11173 SS5]